MKNLKRLTLSFNILKIVIIIFIFTFTFYKLFKHTSFDFLTVIFLIICILLLISIEKLEQYIVYKFYK